MNRKLDQTLMIDAVDGIQGDVSCIVDLQDACTVPEELQPRLPSPSQKKIRHVLQM
jgi:hypothetical protein